MSPFALKNFMCVNARVFPTVVVVSMVSIRVEDPVALTLLAFSNNSDLVACLAPGRQIGNWTVSVSQSVHNAAAQCNSPHHSGPLRRQLSTVPSTPQQESRQDQPYWRWFHHAGCSTGSGIGVSTEPRLCQLGCFGSLLTSYRVLLVNMEIKRDLANTGSNDT